MRVCWYVPGKGSMVQSYTLSDQLAITHTCTHSHRQGACPHSKRSAGFTLQPYLFLHTATLKAGDLNNMACQEIESKLKKKNIMPLFKFKNVADKAGLN